MDSDTPRNGYIFGNAEGPWSTDKISKVLARESGKCLGFRVTIADYRHISVAIDRKFIRKNEIDIDDDDDDEDEDDANDLMAAHRSKTAINRYGRQSGLLRKLSAESIDIFRSIADKWHAWLGLISRMPREEDELDSMDLDREDLSSEEKIQIALHELYGGSASFKGKQKEAVTAVVNGISPLLVNLPTGGGKSLTFLIPALFPEAKTTVIITPLVALGDDLLKRCEKAGISSFIYGKTRPKKAKIVIVVTETTLSSAFSQFILDLYLENQLERIIYDEAHKIVTDVNYRPKLEDLKRMDIPVQMVFMTATMPPTLLPEFKKAMVLESLEEIRQDSHKPNFRYGVQVDDGDDDEDKCLDLILQGIGRCEGEEKVHCL